MRRLASIVAAILVIVFAAAAQTATGIITGNVTDVSGAVVPGAKVTIENLKTGVKQTIQSNSRGSLPGRDENGRKKEVAIDGAPIIFAAHFLWQKLAG